MPGESVPLRASACRSRLCAVQSGSDHQGPVTAQRYRGGLCRLNLSGILLLLGAHDRAHYAFVLASGAAALGRQVVLFATNAGCHALLSDWWSGLTDAGRDEKVRAAGVAGLAELREAARTSACG